MASSSTSDHGENMDANAASNFTQPGLTPREGQLSHGITDPQLQLIAMSQQQNEPAELTDVLREQQEGPVPGFSSGVRARTVSLRGSVSCERPGPVPPAGGGGGEPSTSEYDRLPSPEQPRNAPLDHSQSSPHLHDPVTFAGPNAPLLQRCPEHGGPLPGHPGCQQSPPFQGQGRLLGQPPHHRWDQSGRQPMNPPPQRPFPFITFPRSVLIFDQPHDRMGRTVGFAYRSSVTLSTSRDMGPGARQLLPGWPYPVVLQSSVHLQTRTQMHPQTSFQMNPRIPPRINPQISPQMQTRGPVPTNLGTPSEPPPPYPGPSLAPGEPMSVTNRAGPSTDRQQTPRTSRIPAAPQLRSLRSDSDDVPENNGAGLDVGGEGEAAGRARTRTEPPRKARPTKPYE